MTSVPKPLKFMRPFYNDMIAIYEKIQDAHDKVLFTFFIFKIIVFLLGFMC
jgi:hypothetical protein